ncbi:MAG TPA: FAD-dependent monooxygenase [Terriglobales bacterium]|nr:FAD-dependent monooxygenase [Terriglobales bacterium]
MYDLIVIGGGPAGASAAITSCRTGAHVLLLERGRFPRHKVCGEFVSAEALGLLGSLLELTYSSLPYAVPIPRARFFVDDRVLEAAVQPAAASIARLDLDRSLWDSAERCGTEARQQVIVQNLSGSGPFVVCTSIGDFETRAVVNASGRWSTLNGAQSRNGNGGAKWIGLKAHYLEPAPPASVDLYFFDGGYCGVQPVNLSSAHDQARVNACAMVRADVASTMPETFELHPALRERAARWTPVMNPVGVSPLLFGKPRPIEGSVLSVGDAAGFVDPFVGDGISLALRSGALAAESLAPFFAGQLSLAQAIRQYAESYQLHFASVFRSSSRIRRMLRLPRPVRAPILSLLAHSTAVTEYLVRQTR